MSLTRMWRRCKGGSVNANAVIGRRLSTKTK